MTTYRCIGRGTTDANGIARITHDCNGNALTDTGYTGTGIGKVQIIASPEPPTTINTNSIQSEPHTVTDGVFYDPATSTTHKTNYYNTNSTNLTATYSDNGTTLTSVLTSGSAYYRTRNTVNGSVTTNWRDTDTDYTIEVDITYEDNTNNTDGTCRVCIGGTGTNQITSLYSLTEEHQGTIHLTIKTEGEQATYYINNEEITTKTMTDSNHFQFNINKSATLTFKNLIIYRR